VLLALLFLYVAWLLLGWCICIYSLGLPSTLDREPRLCGRTVAAHLWEGRRPEESVKHPLTHPPFHTSVIVDVRTLVPCNIRRIGTLDKITKDSEAA
jgi:hypothetical protein